MSQARSDFAGEASKDGEEAEEENFDLQGEFQEDSLLELSTCSSLSISLNGSLPIDPILPTVELEDANFEQDNSEDCDITPSNNTADETDLANNNCPTEDEATDLENDPENLETSHNQEQTSERDSEAKDKRGQTNGVELEYEYEPGISLSNLEFASAPDLFSETKCFLCGFDSESGRRLLVPITNH